MSTLIHKNRFDRTLAGLVEQYGRAEYWGMGLEAWVFEDRASRRAAETAMSARGIQARFRSAFKPLLAFFLEDINLEDVTRADVVYPMHGKATEERFLTEAYPLAALLPPGVVSFSGKMSDDLHYDVAVIKRDGKKHDFRVFAPNREHISPAGENVLSPTGWLRLTRGEGEVLDQQIETDYELAFWDVLSVVNERDWGPVEPFFDRLEIRMDVPAQDEPIGYGQEAFSLSEAMHEELYFSLIEMFQARTGRPSDSLAARPGQIVPTVTAGAAEVRVCLELSDLCATNPARRRHNLAIAPEPIGLEQVAAELGALVGTPFEARSRAGRAVMGLYRRGSDPAMVITGAQHANETSGVIGALRAADALSRRPDAHFAVIPVENVDGYALNLVLGESQPRHLHHAARYTSSGDDLDLREGVPELELEARRLAIGVSGAKLHINLHGYPAHEWVRPLSGYFPPRAHRWTLPMGFYVLMSFMPGWGDAAEAMLARLCSRMGETPGLRAFNEKQIEIYRSHVGNGPLSVSNGLLCRIREDGRQETPLKLVTEFPDESIYGAEYIFAHTIQMEAILSAHAAMREVFGSGRHSGMRGHS